MALCRNVAVAMVVVVAAVMVLRAQGIGQCSFDLVGLVYPYGAYCWEAAVYGEVFELAAARGADPILGWLAPEAPEAEGSSSSDNRMRLAEVGAKYKLTQIGLEGQAVRQNENVELVNVESGRALGWQEAEGGEWQLVEGGASNFQFSSARSVHVACGLRPQQICVTYQLLSNGTRWEGLSPFEEEGVTYFKLGSSLQSFQLWRSTTNSVLTMPA